MVCLGRSIPGRIPGEAEEYQGMAQILTNTTLFTQEKKSMNTAIILGIDNSGYSFSWCSYNFLILPRRFSNRPGSRIILNTILYTYIFAVQAGTVKCHN